MPPKAKDFNKRSEENERIAMRLHLKYHDILFEIAHSWDKVQNLLKVWIN